MSGLIYPNFLAGKMLTQRKSPTFNTHTQKALSGKESRIAYRAYPLYEWELEYEFLSDNHPLMAQRTNYIPWSQDFSQWSPNQAGSGLPPLVYRVWPATKAPDGTYTANRLILNIGNGVGASDSQISSQGVTQFNNGTVLTYSIWMKTNDGSTATILLVTTPNGAGQLVTVTGVWTRYQFTQTIGGSGGVNSVYVSLNAPYSAATLYADLSVWGAQVEVGALATLPYIATFGAPIVTSDLQTIVGFYNRMLGQYDTFLYQDPDFNTVTQQQFATGNGSVTAFNLTATYEPGNSFPGAVVGTLPSGLAGQPELVQNTLGSPVIYTNRFGSPELLTPTSRTNILPQSNFGSTSWGTFHATLTNNVAVGPDGSSSASQLTDDTAVSAHDMSPFGGLALTASSRYTFSAWLKHTNHQFVGLVFDDGGTDGVGVIVDLINDVVSAVFILGTAYASNADVGLTVFPNGWVRVWLSGQQKPSVTTGRVYIIFCQNFTTAPWGQVYAGSGSDTFQCWGAQFELGTLPTAIIPTTTSPVTVAADYSLSNLSTVGDVNTFQQIQFAAAPPVAAVLTWTGTFLYRVRFSEDKNDFREIYGRHIWDLDKIALEQVIL